MTRQQHYNLLLAGFLFAIDRILKYIAPGSSDLGLSYLGWHYFENIGVAFGIRVPLLLVILATPIILAFIYKYMVSYANPISMLGAWFITAGALSNLFDRIVYGFVIDYIRIGTAIINVADVLVVLGVLLIIWTSKQKKPSI